MRDGKADARAIAAQVVNDHGSDALDFALEQVCAAIMAGDAGQDQHWTRVAEFVERELRKKQYRWERGLA